MTVKTTPQQLFYNARIIQRLDFTPKLSIFRVAPETSDDFPDGNLPEFVAGQYAILGLNSNGNGNGDSDAGKTSRAYSIASAPEERRWLEFYIRFVDEPTSKNPLTHLLWKTAAGDPIHLRPAINGKFTIAETIGDDDPRLKIFVAAGTGVAPFVSMVKSRLANPRLRDRMAILHGASYTADLSYHGELSGLSAANERFIYFPTISRPKESAGWTGETGRVESLFESGRIAQLEQRLGLKPGGLNPENAVIYICGLVGTIQNMLAHGLRSGFVPSNRQVRRGLNLDDLESSLFYEQYDTTPIIDLKDADSLRALLAETPFSGRI